MLALWLVLLPIIAGLLFFALPAGDTRLSKTLGAIVSGATVVMAAFAQHQEWSFRWLSRPFEAAFHFGANSISFWIVLLLALCTFSAILATNISRQRNFLAQMLL